MNIDYPLGEISAAQLHFVTEIALKPLFLFYVRTKALSVVVFVLGQKLL